MSVLLLTGCFFKLVIYKFRMSTVHLASETLYVVKNTYFSTTNIVSSFIVK